MQKLTAFLLLSAFIALSSCQGSISKSNNNIFLDEAYHTGYVDIEKRGSAFYWLFESRKDACKAPLILYLDDIQGWASQLAVFLEGGPYRIQKDNTLKRNPSSWNNIANILYADVKLGSGFSVAASVDSIPDTHSGVADDIFIFLQGFLKQHPEFNGRDLYIRSRAQGSRTLTFLGARILDNAKKLNLNFKGFMIASPRFAEEYQLETIPQYGYENNLIDRTTYRTLQQEFARASELIRHPENVEGLFEADSIYGNGMTTITQNRTINAFDMRKPCVQSDSIACYDITFIRKFLLQPKVTKALGVRDAAVSTWTEINVTVWFRTSIQNYYLSTLKEMSVLVQRGLPIVFYGGEWAVDYNWMGSEKVANLLEWKKQAQFANKKYTKWGSSGEYKTVDNLTLMKVRDSGFFVGMDQPKVELDILERTIKRGW